MKLSTTQQKLHNHLEEFLTKEDKSFMFIQPRKRCGLSYCLCSFLVNLAMKYPGEFSDWHILYISDTKYATEMMYKDFCSMTKDDKQFVHISDNKSIVRNITYHFDVIGSPRLRVLNEKTFLLLDLRITEKHPFLDAIQQYQFKSVWIKRGFSEGIKEWIFDDNFNLKEEDEWIVKCE